MPVCKTCKKTVRGKPHKTGNCPACRKANATHERAPQASASMRWFADWRLRYG